MVNKEAFLNITQGLDSLSPLPKKHLIESNIGFKGDYQPVIRSIKDIVESDLTRAKAIELLNPFGKWKTVKLQDILAEIEQFVAQTFEQSWANDVSRCAGNCSVTVQRNPIVGTITFAISFDTSTRLGDGTAYHDGQTWRMTQRKGTYTGTITRLIKVKL